MKNFENNIEHQNYSKKEVIFLNYLKNKEIRHNTARKKQSNKNKFRMIHYICADKNVSFHF